MKLNLSRHKTAIPMGIVLMIALVQISCSVNDPYGDHDQDSEARASFHYRFPSDGVIRFAVQGINGNIDITGISSSDSVEVWGERVVRAEDQTDAEDHLSLLTVEAGRIESSIEVQTRQPNRTEGKTYEVIYHVRLPKSMMVSTGLVNGLVSIGAISNQVQVSSTNGNVVCSDILGDCAVALVNGLIDCEIVLPLHGQCSLTTVNGNISLSIPDTTSAQLEAKVTNGEVSVSGLRINNIHSSRTAVSGDLGSGNGTIQLTTVNGNVHIEGID